MQNFKFINTRRLLDYHFFMCTKNGENARSSPIVTLPSYRQSTTISPYMLNPSKSFSSVSSNEDRPVTLANTILVTCHKFNVLNFEFNHLFIIVLSRKEGNCSTYRNYNPSISFISFAASSSPLSAKGFRSSLAFSRFWFFM